MKVQKRKKDLIDYIDSLTMKRIKCIIWLCVIVGVLSEFFPDYTQLFPGVAMYKVVVNIQEHRDFFTNIFWGVLEVLLFRMLYYSSRIKKGKKIELMHWRSAIRVLFAVSFL